MTAVFLLGTFWRRGNEAGAFATLAIGVPLSIAGWVANEMLGWLPIQYLYAAGIMFALSCALMVGVSLATKPPPAEQVQAHVWRPRMWREESRELAAKPWYANYRHQAGALALLALGIVAWWW